MKKKKKCNFERKIVYPTLKKINQDITFKNQFEWLNVNLCTLPVRLSSLEGMNDCEMKIHIKDDMRYHHVF